MWTILVLSLAIQTTTSRENATSFQCRPGPDCGPWLNDDNFQKVPYEVGNCCPILTSANGSCPLGDSSYEFDKKRCASFCPERVTYEWGQEVFYLNQDICTQDERSCTLDPNSKAIFRGPPVPNDVSSKALYKYAPGGFDQDSLMAVSGGVTLNKVIPSTNKSYGVYWTFIPLCKVTCGVYTETVNNVVNATYCSSSANQINSVVNTCVKEVVRRTDNDLIAVGITQPIPIHISDNGQIGKVDQDLYSKEYIQPGVALPYDGEHNDVRLTFSTFLEQKSEIMAIANPGNVTSGLAIDEYPLVKDCLHAIGKFYAVLWSNQTHPSTGSWANGCSDKLLASKSNDGGKRGCLVISHFATCEVQLTFDWQDTTVNALQYYSDICLTQVGGVLWPLLSSFTRLFEKSIEGKDGEHVAGYTDLGEDVACNCTVAFVPSKGANVTETSRPGV